LLALFDRQKAINFLIAYFSGPHALMLFLFFILSLFFHSTQPRTDCTWKTCYLAHTIMDPTVGLLVQKRRRSPQNFLPNGSKDGSTKFADSCLSTLHTLGGKRTRGVIHPQRSFSRSYGERGQQPRVQVRIWKICL